MLDGWLLSSYHMQAACPLTKGFDEGKQTSPHHASAAAPPWQAPPMMSQQRLCCLQVCARCCMLPRLGGACIKCFQALAPEPCSHPKQSQYACHRRCLLSAVLAPPPPSPFAPGRLARTRTGSTPGKSAWKCTGLKPAGCLPSSAGTSKVESSTQMQRATCRAKSGPAPAACAPALWDPSPPPAGSHSCWQLRWPPARQRTGPDELQSGPWSTCRLPQRVLSGQDQARSLAACACRAPTPALPCKDGRCCNCIAVPSPASGRREWVRLLLPPCQHPEPGVPCTMSGWLAAECMGMGTDGALMVSGTQYGSSGSVMSPTLSSAEPTCPFVVCRGSAVQKVASVVQLRREKDLTKKA